MKKFLTIIILSHFLLTININTSIATETELLSNDDTLKIGVLVPTKGQQKQIGISILNSVKLAVQDINSKKLKIYPKDIGETPEERNAALNYFTSIGVKVVIGPIFYEFTRP